MSTVIFVFAPNVHDHVHLGLARKEILQAELSLGIDFSLFLA